MSESDKKSDNVVASGSSRTSNSATVFSFDKDGLRFYGLMKGLFFPGSAEYTLRVGLIPKEKQDPDVIDLREEEFFQVMHMGFAAGADMIRMEILASEELLGIYAEGDDNNFDDEFMPLIVQVRSYIVTSVSSHRQFMGGLAGWYPPIEPERFDESELESDQ